MPKNFKQYVLVFEDKLGKSHVSYHETIQEAIEVLKRTGLEKGSKPTQISPYVNQEKCFLYEKTNNNLWKSFLE